MAIAKLPQLKTTESAPESKPADTEKAFKAFVSGAPDAGAAKTEAVKAKKTQITHTIDTELLAMVEEYAKELGMSRSAVLNLGAKQLMERGAVIQGKPKAQAE